LGGTGSRLDDHFLEGVCVSLETSTAEHAFIHSRHVVSHIVGALAVDTKKAAVTSDAPDIVEVCAASISGGNKRKQLSGTFGRRKRIQRDLRNGDLLLDVLDVYHRSLLRDCDRFIQPTDLEIAIQ